MALPELDTQEILNYDTGWYCKVRAEPKSLTYEYILLLLLARWRWRLGILGVL